MSNVNTDRLARHWLLSILVISIFAVPLLLANWGGQTEAQWFYITRNRLASAGIPLVAAIVATVLLFRQGIQQPNKLDRLLEQHSPKIYKGLVTLLIAAGFFYVASSTATESPNYYYYLNLRPLVLYLGLCCLISLYFVAKLAPPSKSTKSGLAVFSILILAACIRVLHLAYIDINLPYSLGGLFVQFARSIQMAGFGIPEWIPYYTEGGLPFAYPPLSFLVEGILFSIFPLNYYAIANLLPVIFTLATLPLMHALVKELKFSSALQLATLVAFCFFPSTFYEQKESAGLAEALGSVALIVFYIAIHRFWKTPGFKTALWMGAALAFCVVSSPGSGYFSGIISVAIILFALLRRDVERTRWLVIVGAIGILASAPYWLPVMRFHGPKIFVEGVSNQNYASFFQIIIENILRFAFVTSNRPVLWGVFTIIGAFWSLLRKESWAFILFLVSLAVAREGTWIASIPASILSGYGLLLCVDLARKAFYRLLKNTRELNIGASILLAVFFGFATTWAIKDSLELVRFYNRSRWESEVTAMEWSAINLPKEAQMVSFGMPTHENNEAVEEWMPMISQRTTLDVIFGTEWKWSATESVLHYQSAENCKNLACISQVVSKAQDPALVYLLTTEERFNDLLDDVAPPISYAKVYDVDKIIIFHLP